MLLEFQCDLIIVLVGASFYTQIMKHAEVQCNNIKSLRRMDWQLGE